MNTQMQLLRFNVFFAPSPFIAREIAFSLSPSLFYTSSLLAIWYRDFWPPQYHLCITAAILQLVYM